MTGGVAKPADTTRFDRGTFTAALSQAVEAEQSGQAHGAAAKILKQAVETARRDALDSSERGDRTAAHFARNCDEIVTALFALLPHGKDEIALVAIGGYGRGKLAPYSDVDLLVLHETASGDDFNQALNFILYPLWDSGLKLSHSVHTPGSAAEFAKEDMVARTAFLDARFLAGSKKLFDKFTSAYDKLRRRTKSEFVKAKLEEQEKRQSRADETRYLVEPDLKEGKGALRDVQTIGWLYKYAFGGDIGDSKAIDKILDPSEKRALRKVERFFWSVRMQLHDLRGGPDDLLTFDIQPEVAARLGYADRRDMTAAERLMKHYFVNAVEVGRLTRVLCAKLEEARAKGLPRLPAMLPKALQSDEAPGKPNLRIKDGRLDFESATKARRSPRDFFRLFRAFSKKPKIDFHPDALAIISEQLPEVTSDVRKDLVIAKLFRGVMVEAEDPVRVLRIMTETGLLGKYIPSFGSIVGRIRYGLYRRYTLDEHVLRVIGVLKRIERGELKKEHPLASAVVQKAPDPMVFYIAILLHESIWTVKDQSVAECQKLVQRVAKRMGLGEEQASLAAWAAANHHTLVRTAERRNITEAYAVSKFASQIGTRERLDLMLVLSVCRLRIVSLYSWDEVTRRQITELYEATVAWFEGGEEALHRRLDARASLARLETKTKLADWPEEEKENFLRRLSAPILRSLDPGIIVRFAYLARAAEKDRADAAVTVTPRDGDYEAIIYADDRPGLLADIAGAVAATGLSLRTVQALTTEDGKAFDIALIQSADGVPLDDSRLAARLHSTLLSVARGGGGERPEIPRQFGDRRSIFSVAPEVRIELAASEDATVIEAEGLDRPGLLCELTAALSSLGVSIVSAHIATYGERAVDAFYLLGEDGNKITDERLLSRIEKALKEVLSAGSE